LKSLDVDKMLESTEDSLQKTKPSTESPNEKEDNDEDKEEGIKLKSSKQELEKIK
jgi:hypothetical protein